MRWRVEARAEFGAAKDSVNQRLSRNAPFGCDTTIRLFVRMQGMLMQVVAERANSE